SSYGPGRGTPPHCRGVGNFRQEARRAGDERNFRLGRRDERHDGYGHHHGAGAGKKLIRQGGMAGAVFCACVEMLGRRPAEALPRMTRRQMWMLLSSYEFYMERAVGMGMFAGRRRE